jgi:hypothetical protein
MNHEEIKARMVMALTAYDRRQSTKRSYNRYALPQYFARLDEIMADHAAGAPLRQAICAGFHASIANACLKAIGEAAWAPADQPDPLWYYKPVSKP